MPRQPPLRVAIGLSILLIACGPTAAFAQSRPVQRDSIGVTIYDSRVLGPRVTATEVLRIGTVDGPPETTFHRVVDAKLGSDETLVVLDGGDNVVKVFDRVGTLLASMGRTGEGPSEFGTAWRIEVHGDTIRVLDTSLRKIVIFQTNGSLLDTYRIDYSVAQHGFPVTFASRPDGGLVIAGVSGCGFPRQPTDNMWGVYTLDPNGAIADTIEQKRIENALPVYLRRARSSSCTVISWPFVPGPTVAFDRAGHAVTSPGNAYEIRWLDTSLERVTSIVRYPGPNREVTRTHRRAFEAAWRARENLDRDLRAAIESAVDSAGYADTWPALGGLEVAGPEVVWARRVVPSGETEQEWDVIARGGHVRTIVLPADIDVMDVWGDRILGTGHDKLGVQYVVVYEVPR